MTLATRPTSQLSRRYAQALLDTALDKKAERDVSSDMADVAVMLERQDVLADFVAAPLYSKEEQFKAIDALGKKAKFHKLTINFLKMLADNKRLPALLEMTTAYKQALREHNDEVFVGVQTAYELNKTQMSDLGKTLKKALGQDIEIRQQVDESLLGGMVVTVGSVMIDDSIKGKLERLKLKMKSGTNENNQLKEVG